MIIDKIENAKLYVNIHKRVAEGLAYLQNLDINSLTLGKQVIDGDLLYAITSEFRTKPKESVILEAHKKYLDIHYVLEGSEQIGVATLYNQKIHKEYSHEDDYMLFEGPTDIIKLKKGMFAIFFPDDLHMPGIHTENAENVKKIVIKVKW
tara:strand:- start:40175 stop:40624 length:450 start_codon:yes stop_codon:yes gene_type:complete